MSRNDETRPIGDVKFIAGGGGFYPARRCDGALRPRRDGADRQQPADAWAHPAVVVPDVHG